MGNSKVEAIRKIYKPGDRLECVYMEDVYGVLPGTQGTVDFVDDAGNVHMKWDNGRTLSVLPDIDKVKHIVE